MIPSGNNTSFWAEYVKNRDKEKTLSDADAFALGYAPGTSILSSSTSPLNPHQSTQVVRIVVREPATAPAVPEETPYAPHDTTADLDTRIKLGTFQGRPCLWVVKENKWHPIFIAKFRARIIQHLYDRRMHVDERTFRLKDLADALGKGEQSVWNALNEIQNLPTPKKIIRCYSRGRYGLGSGLDCCKDL